MVSSLVSSLGSEWEGVVLLVMLPLPLSRRELRPEDIVMPLMLLPLAESRIEPGVLLSTLLPRSMSSMPPEGAVTLLMLISSDPKAGKTPLPPAPSPPESPLAVFLPPFLLRPAFFLPLFLFALRGRRALQEEGDDCCWCWCWW